MFCARLPLFILSGLLWAGHAGAQAAEPATPNASAPAGPAPEAGARIRIGGGPPGLWLEMREFGGDAGWQQFCAAPCGQFVTTEGREARLTAPGMTPSGPFRVVPGGGTATLSVNPGSLRLRSFGRASWITGVPLALLGMFAFAYGSYEDRAGLRAGGALALGGGAGLSLLALPLLVLGSTKVHDADGDLVAQRGGAWHW